MVPIQLQMRYFERLQNPYTNHHPFSYKYTLSKVREERSTIIFMASFI